MKKTDNRILELADLQKVLLSTCTYLNRPIRKNQLIKMTTELFECNTAKEVEILKKLYANAGRIVTLGALCQTVCGDIYIGYEKTLMSHIRHIREKIEEEPSSPVSLITVKGIGYKLVLKDKTR
jgi:DNA-binding response OmpR family regulator